MGRAAPVGRAALWAGVSALALLLASGFNPADATTLEEAVRQAIANSPDVGAAAGDRRAADEQIRQAKSAYLPQADIRTAIGREYANTPSTRGASPPGEDDSQVMNRTESNLTIRQMLFDGFQTPTDVQRRRALSESAASRVLQTSEGTGLDAIEAYVDVLRFTDVVAINQENVRTHEAYVAALSRRVEVGAGDVGDLRRAQSRLASAKGILADAEGQLVTARSRYNRTVGDMPVDLERPTAPDKALPADVEAGVELALRANPAVQRAEAEAEAAQKQVRQLKAAYYPSFDLEVNGFTGDNLRGVTGRDTAASALLVMRYNLSRGGGDYYRVQEAIERLAAANQRLAAARRDAERDMRLAWNALAVARDRAKAADEQVQSDARGRDAFRRQFDIGRSRILDLLDSERDYYNSLSLRTSQEAVALFGVFRVLQSGGVLLRTMNIRPPDEAIREDQPWSAAVAVTAPAPGTLPALPGQAEPLPQELVPGLRLRPPPELRPDPAQPLAPGRLDRPRLDPSGLPVAPQPPRPPGATARLVQPGLVPPGLSGAWPEGAPLPPIGNADDDLPTLFGAWPRGVDLPPLGDPARRAPPVVLPAARLPAPRWPGALAPPPLGDAAAAPRAAPRPSPGSAPGSDIDPSPDPEDYPDDSDPVRERTAALTRRLRANAISTFGIATTVVPIDVAAAAPPDRAVPAPPAPVTAPAAPPAGRTPSVTVRIPPAEGDRAP